MQLLITLLLLFSPLSFHHATISGSEPAKDDWKSYRHANYSVKYPPSWTLDNSGDHGTAFILFSPKESADDDFIENVNLLIQDVGGMDLDGYTKLSEEQIASGKFLSNSKLLESNRIRNRAGDYQRVFFTSGDEGSSMKFEQYYWVRDRKAYVVTLTAKEDLFEGYRGVGEKILDSFKFTR
jgi:serine/threonine-protein kinase